MRRTTGDWVLLFFKGTAMGAADAIPGVSGGTVAFISGIYQELLDSIRRITPQSLLLLGRQGPRAFWDHINGTFLLVLLSGVLLSLASVARLAIYLLEQHPTLLWAFFFGLIVSSSIWMMTQVKRWNSVPVIALWVGMVGAYLVTAISPVEVEATPLMVFGAGCIAICAMILPGISGSFILLLLGLYGPIMGAIKDFDLQVLTLFMAGCVLGLLSFSHLLAWMFRNQHDLILALLTGVMLGSLSRVWPWKYTTEYRINTRGDTVPLLQDNVLPVSYQALTGQDAMLWGALLLMLLGAVAVYMLERSGKRG
ncbi:MAG: putative membrane protein [Motiliproteus sp.]|jgi:putative membrane protein